MHYCFLKTIKSAKDFFEKANQSYTLAFGPNHFKVGETLFTLAKIDMGWKERENAEKKFLRALEIFEENTELSHTLNQSTHAFLVGLY